MAVAVGRRVVPNWQNELQLCFGGHMLVAGVDEAGRGAWAGPLVAGAVIFPNPHELGIAASAADMSGLGRFFTAFVLGPVYVFVTYWFNVATGGYVDLEHFYPSYPDPDYIQRVNHFMLQEGIMIAAAVLIIIVDTWRLVADHNLRLNADRDSVDGQDAGT